MKKYIGTTTVIATQMTRKEYNDYRHWTVPADENPDDKGYLVEHQDGGKPNDERHKGYISWSPSDRFSAVYRPYGNLTFGQALEALKQGKKVARAGWNGKGMFLWLKPAAMVKSEWCKDPLLKKLADDNGGEIEALGTICMHTAQRSVLTGWLASQSDMLLEDWTIIE